jgi:hypothetical protein
VHTVVETPGYLTAAKAAGISDAVRRDIVTAVGSVPDMGELIVGAGGLRKFRFARPGGGKSGGYRILSFYLSDNYPVFLIGAFAKNQKENITTAEKAILAKRLRTMIETYTKAARR